MEASGGEWKVCNPNPPDPPKNSVQNPPAGAGMPMMGWGGGGWGWGAPSMPPHAMMQHPGMGQQMFPPMHGYPGMGHGPMMPGGQMNTENGEQLAEVELYCPE